MTKNIKILLITHGLMSFIMWYAVEKVFMQSINVSLMQMGILASSYVGISALLNVPTGIFADKFGRKTALILASVFLLISTIITGTANNFWQYFVGAILWGIFYTTQNGAFSAILYDELKSSNNEDRFAKIKSYASTIGWLSIFASSMIGAFIGEHLGLREVFYFTLIPNIICLLLCLKISEPKIHSKSEPLSNIHMIKQSFKTLFSSSIMIKLSTLFLCLQALSWTFNEYDQLYFLALGFGVLGTGILGGFSGLMQAFGSYLGGKFSKINLYASFTVSIGLSLLLSIFTNNTRFIGITVFLFMIIIIQTALIGGETKLQHQIQSKIRATAMSSLSMVNDIIMVIIFLGFGAISQRSNTKNGFMVVTVFILVVFIFGYFVSLSSKKSPLQTQS